MGIFYFISGCKKQTNKIIFLKMKLFLLSVLLPNALAAGESLKINEEKFGRENRGLPKAACRYHFLINSQIERELTASYFYFRHSLFYSSIASPSPNLAKMLMKKSKEETEHAENLAKFQLERDGTIWAGNSLPNTEGCHGTPTIGCAITKMIELETDITAKLLELSRYAANGNNYSQIDGDLYPENDILVDPTTCEAPHIEDFIIANYLSEQREDLYQLKMLKTRYEVFEADDVRFDAEILSKYV